MKKLHRDNSSNVLNTNIENGQTKRIDDIGIKKDRLGSWKVT